MRKRHNHIGLAEGWGQDTVVLLHEVTHAATRLMKDESEFPAHGEEFAGVIITLWSEFLECGDSDWAFLNSKAEEHGLDVSYNLLKDGS